MHNHSLRLRILARSSLAALALAPLLALTACASESTGEDAPEPVETTSVAPDPEPAFQGASPEDYIIPAGLDAQTLGTEIVEGALTDWANAGGNNTLRDRIRASDESREVVTAEVAAENRVVVVDTLFIPGWESIDSLVSFASGGETSNEETIRWYAATAWTSEEPKNVEGYRAWMEVEAVREVDDGDGAAATRTILVDYTNHANTDKNVGPEPQRAGGTIELHVTSDGTQERLTYVNFT